MTIFFVGLGLFAAGFVINVLGWRLHRSEIKAVPGNFLDWLLDVIRHWYGVLTGPDSTFGQRVAAFGAILEAIGIVTTVAGLIAWAQ
jgi:hypothetical protein